MYSILIIEDDKTIRQELESVLRRYNYEVIAPDEFDDVINFIMSAKADLILLDIGLPQYDGYHICREIRKESDVPIIIVTSRNTEMDELMSLQLGADDFVIKPFNTQILLSRIENVLKRKKQTDQASSSLVVGEVSVNLENGTLSCKDQIVELTKNELRILTILMKNQNKIIARDTIIMELWQSDDFIDDNTLTVNINRLRKKLEDAGVFDFIQTKRGLGYIIQS